MEFEELDEDIFGCFQPDSPPASTHCDIPLKFSKQRAALGIPSPGQYLSRNNHLKEELNDIFKQSGKLTFHRLDLSQIQRRLLSLSVPSILVVLMEWNQQFRVGNLLWGINIDALSSSSMLPLPSGEIKFSQEDLEYLYKHYLIRTFWEEGVLASGSIYCHPRFWWKKYHKVISCQFGNMAFYLTSNLFVIKSPFGNYLTSRDHLLILSDLSSQRYLLKLLSILESHHPNPSFLNLIDLDNILDLGDRILERSGNQAYKYIYTLESSCVSLLTGNIPVGTPNAPTFREAIKTDTLKLASSLDILDLHELREDFFTKIEHNPSMISQVYGLYRIWGHPTLEPLEGTSALKQIVTKVRGFYQEYSNAITYKFKEEFIIRYIKQEKKWPNLDVSRLSPLNPIRESYEHKTDYPVHHSKYCRSQLNLVKFNQIFPVDPKFDLVEMISDKAMSLFTPELISNLTSGKGVGTSIDRSVLVQWLGSALHDPVEFLRTIDKHGFTYLEKSLGVKEKEREGKIEARLFGLMTLIKRMYIVLTEALLAEYILSYFPEITMVDDELSLDKKRLIFNDVSLYNRSVFTSLDFSKWNSNMREAETNGIFLAFDQMFGFENCFQRTHEMFKDSFIYLLNGSYLPKFSGGKFKPDLGSWYGHLGGIEGLRQKGWTVWTVSLILLAAENYPIRLKLMGQGDNQILREIFPEEIDQSRQMEIHFQFLEKLDSILQYTGPPLKMEETWTSRDFFVYGKYLIYKGAALPMYGKRICRMFRLSNEDFPTIESTISSLTANLSSALSYSFSPGYLLYIYYTELIGIFQLFFSISYLHKIPILDKLSKPATLTIPHSQKSQKISCPPYLSNEPLQPDTLFIKLSLLPRCLGGFPVSNIFSATLRGFPDEVSFAISSLKLMYPFCTSEIQKSIVSFLNPPIHPEQNFMLLFEHPTALNLNIPPTPSEARRNQIINFLKTSKRVKNPYLKTFLSLLNTPIETELITYLSLSKPFCPRLLSQISSSTVEARARHIANKLQKTKTISCLAQRESKIDIYGTIESCETNHVLSVLRLIHSSQPNDFNWSLIKCSVQHAQELRNNSWKRIVEGVDCVPPQEFIFIESLKSVEQCHVNLELEKGHIVMRFSSSLTESQLENPLILGHFKPYRGSTTKQKISGFGDKLAEVAEPLLQKILRAFNLIGWGIKPGGNLATLLERLLEARTDLDPKWIIPDESKLAGSIHHRLQDDRTGHGGSVSLLPNYSSKFTFDTFPLYEYSKGSKNVNLMFQSIMSYSVILADWALSLGWVPHLPTIHLHVRSSCCVRDVNEELVECDNKNLPCIMTNKLSPYLYTSAEVYLTNYLKELLIQSDAPMTFDSGILQRRFISALSEEMLEIVQPYNWNLPHSEFVRKSLVINWCLNAPIIQVLEFLCLRLCVFYIDSVRHSTVNQFLIRVGERVIRSSSVAWSQLSNLIFCQDINHYLVSEPYYIRLSGNPCMNDEIMGSTLKDACHQILLVWSMDPTVLSRLYSLELYGSQNTGLHQHPSILILMREWLNGSQTIHIKQMKYEILRLISSEQQETNEPLSIIANNYIKKARGLIFKESIDYLSKKIPQIAPIKSDLEIDPLPYLPESAISLGRFNRNQLIRSEFTIYPLQESHKGTYITHYIRGLSTPTSGMYKALSILTYLQLHHEYNYLCLADGGGGYTWAVLRLNSDNHVFYNSLITSEDTIQQAPPIPFIPALSGWKHMEKRVDNFELTNDGISNIFHPEYPIFLKTHLVKKYKGLICDAESPNYLMGTFVSDVAFSTVNICRTLELKWALVKSYALNPLALRAQISIFLSYFHEVQIIRSDFSAAGNTEIFIYCYNPGTTSIIAVGDNRVYGDVLSDFLLMDLEDIKLSLINGATYFDTEVLASYTGLIVNYLWEPLDKSILTTLPMIAEQVDLIYPHSVLTWMRTSSQLKPGAPKIIISHLETRFFTRPLIKQWCMWWLLLGTWSEVLDFKEIPEIVSNSVCIWYLLNDKTWEISLCKVIPPDELQGYRMLVWDVSSLIGSKELKIFYRTLGILHSYPNKPRALSNFLERGNLNIHGHKITGGKLPQDCWIMEHVYKDPDLAGLSTYSTNKGDIRAIWNQRQRRRRRIS